MTNHHRYSFQRFIGQQRAELQHFKMQHTGRAMPGRVGPSTARSPLFELAIIIIRRGILLCFKLAELSSSSPLFYANQRGTLNWSAGCIMRSTLSGQRSSPDGSWLVDAFAQRPVLWRVSSEWQLIAFNLPEYLFGLNKLANYLYWTTS